MIYYWLDNRTGVERGGGMIYYWLDNRTGGREGRVVSC